MRLRQELESLRGELAVLKEQSAFAGATVAQATARSKSAEEMVAKKDDEVGMKEKEKKKKRKRKRKRKN